MKYIQNAFCIEGVPPEIIQMLKDAGVPVRRIYPQMCENKVEDVKPLPPLTLKYWQNWRYSVNKGTKGIEDGSA